MSSPLGYIKLFRRSVDSQVFQHEGLWKVWTWCLLKANHKEAWVPIVTGKGMSEVKVGPGQFLFGRQSAAKELRMKPTTIWDRMKKLEKMQNLVIQSDSHYSVVSIVNWDKYQAAETEPDRQADTHPTGNRQATDTNKNEKNEKKNTPGKISGPEPSFEDLRQRYDQSLLEKTFEAIASTRKTGNVAESVLLAQLKAWDRFPVEQVESALKTYLGKGYASQGKNEKYLLGIIRGSKIRPLESPAGDESLPWAGAI